MSDRLFGHLPDGRAVAAVDIAGEGLSATVLALGATLADIVVETPAGPRSVLLGFDRVEDYLAQTAYLGVIAGRCANRIRDGRFDLDGQPVQLTLNEAGRTHLHGGVEGFDKRLWTVEAASAAAVTLALTSPDGDQGYPGTVTVRCRYAIEPGRRLVITLTATTDAPTLVNLAAHGYFALDDSGTVLDHHLTIPAERYTLVDAALIPTGAIDPVAGTRFDFRTTRPIRFEIDGPHAGYDHNWALAGARSETPRPAARLTSPLSGITLDLATTEPGLQVYDGGFLPVPQRLRGGRPGLRFGGLCLEPQRFPDAVHHPDFPGARLNPGETYAQTTEYRFSLSGA